MTKVVESLGWTSFDGNTFHTYFILGRFWLHVNKRFKWPLVSFVVLPF